MSLYSIVAYLTVGALLLLTSLGMIFSLFMPSQDKWNKRYLFILFSLQFICVILCFIDAIIYANPQYVILDKIINLLALLFILILIDMPTLFFIHAVKLSIRKSLMFKSMVILSIFYLVMLIIAQFTDVFYQITENNEFIRGHLFPLLLTPLVTILLLNIIAIFIKRKEIARNYFTAFLIYLPPMMVTIFIHMFTFFELFVFLAVGLWAITILSLVTQENIKQNLQQQIEIANQNASILVLQMRPHFVSNTMMSIYYLCDQDPKKAKQVTLDFATYLRKNFAAMASENTIPFVDELEHTRAYLNVEQAQFEDTLFVDFDTEYTLFRVPPLTLQPIVENAVKHGLTASNKPIHISIRTLKTDKNYEIIVEDDGPGYKPSDDNEPHIALKNITQRLKMMCKGTLEISSKDEGGTVVKVTIPIAKVEEIIEE